MNIHFKCTQCGQCCRDTKVPLTVAEAVQWLNRGHDVQLLCEASPWPPALDSEPKALHFKRRSFAVTSGSMPVRVVALLAGNVVGACPNLLPDNRCGIYAVRPLVCRIYPAEINPFVALKRDNKGCPPEAWTEDKPLLQRGTVLIDQNIQTAIELSRAADASEAAIKSRLCRALNIANAALVHEAVLIYSPTVQALSSALAFAIGTDSAHESGAPWRFVSNQPETLAALRNIGADALDARVAEPASFQHVAFNREAFFDFRAATGPLRITSVIDPSTAK